MRIFVAAPFTAKIDKKTGLLDRKYVRILSRLLEFGKTNHYHIYNAHAREGLGAKIMQPDICTVLDFKAILASDIVVAYPGVSGGVHVELGWASALRKPIVLILKEGERYSPLVVGLSKLTQVRIIRHQTEEETFFELERVLTRIESKLRYQHAATFSASYLQSIKADYNARRKPNC